MVEHMSGAQTTPSPPQSFDGLPAARWYRHPRVPDHHHHHHLPANEVATAAAHQRFSLFRWFRRRNSSGSGDNRTKPQKIFRKKKRRPSVSSSSSSETSYSTSTVRSFAYRAGLGHGAATLKLEPSSCAVGPFAPGAAKLVEKKDNIVLAPASTLPTAFTQRQDIQTRYLLHPFNNSYISFDNIPLIDNRSFAESRKNNVTVVQVDTLTSDSSASVTRKVHVKGKRRAPDPPKIISVHVVSGGDAGSKPSSKTRRKRRPAPKPPGYNQETLSSNQDTLSSEASFGMEPVINTRDCQIISNDTLVLRRGVLLAKKDVLAKRSKVSSSDEDTIVDPVAVNSDTGSTKAIMPRPWYKREHSHNSSRDSTASLRRNGGGDILRGIPSPLPFDAKEESSVSSSNSPTMTTSFPFEGSLARLSFFGRSDRFDDKKKENKRKSGVSILANITELDREAAAIVREEQARNRASMLLQAAKLDEDFERRMGANKDIVEEIVNASMENSPRRSARALISKFNAIGNITKVTVNSNFFNRNSSSPKPKNKRYSQDSNNVHRDHFLDDRLGRDFTKYFLSQQATPQRRDSAAIFSEIVRPGNTNGSRSVFNNNSSRPAVEVTTITVSPRNEDEKSNAEFVNTLTAELDDVASGIARLRRELDQRPKFIENPSERRKEPSRSSDSRALAKFDKEYTQIFNEIDKQLRTRNSTSSSAVQIKPVENGTKSDESAISSQVARVLDILVSAEKNHAEKTNVTSSNTKNIVPVKSQKMKNEETIAKVNDVLAGFKKDRDISATKTVEQPKPISVRDKTKETRVKEAPNGVDKSVADLKALLDATKQHPKRPAKTSESEQGKRSTRLSEILGSELQKAGKKVSSGVQTSGNIRRVIVNGSEARPRENKLITQEARVAAEIREQQKQQQPGKTQENTYANVMERSLRATTAPSRDALVLREKINFPGPERVQRSRRETEKRTAPPEQLDDKFEKAKEEAKKNHHMNTMAVNRLLRKLEAAIASGNHQQAAVLARELAQLKIHCSVVRQRSSSSSGRRSSAKAEKLNLNMYIEDKLAHQGPIPLQLPVNMTVAQLKAKIQVEFEIPYNVQRWIIGKNLADNDESTLEELQALEGSSVFLYLVAPPDVRVDKEPAKMEQQQEDEARETTKNVSAGTRLINENVDEKIDAKPPPEPQPEPEPTPAEVIENEPTPTPSPEPREEKEGSVAKDEKLKRYEELMSLENCDVIANVEPIECPVCFMFTTEGEGVILRDCLHSFCRVCVASVVRYCDEAEVRCPYRDANYTCDSTLQEREIKALVSAEVYQQHLDKSMAQAENNAGNNAFHCKTPDCPGWCIYDDNVNNFLCPVCKVNNCLTCQAIHMGKNCRQYQEELKYSKDTDHESKRTAAMLEEMVDRGEALPCPTCAVVLMKKWGCDWLRCSMCKTEICWVTRGPRWGPAGKGDTSGGCKCGENGVKCHPRCNYCH